MFLILLDSFTSARVTTKYHGIKLQYKEQMHHVYDLLGHLKSKLNLWRGPYGSQESVHSLLQDWHVCGPIDQSLPICHCRFFFDLSFDLSKIKAVVNIASRLSWFVNINCVQSALKSEF